MDGRINLYLPQDSRFPWNRQRMMRLTQKGMTLWFLSLKSLDSIKYHELHKKLVVFGWEMPLSCPSCVQELGFQSLVIFWKMMEGLEGGTSLGNRSLKTGCELTWPGPTSYCLSPSWLVITAALCSWLYVLTAMWTGSFYKCWARRILPSFVHFHQVFWHCSKNGSTWHGRNLAGLSAVPTPCILLHCFLT